MELLLITLWHDNFVSELPSLNTLGCGKWLLSQWILLVDDIRNKPSMLCDNMVMWLDGYGI